MKLRNVFMQFVENKRKKDLMIYELWKLLDDIDTNEDAYKENYKSYANSVHRLQRKRFEIVPDNFIDKLYDRYYDRYRK